MLERPYFLPQPPFADFFFFAVGLALLVFIFTMGLYRFIPRRSDLLYRLAVPRFFFARVIAAEAVLISLRALAIATPSRLLSVLGDVLRRVVELLFLFVIQNNYICFN